METHPSIHERAVRIHVLAGRDVDSQWIPLATVIKQRRHVDRLISDWEILAETSDQTFRLLKRDCGEGDAALWLEKALTGTTETAPGMDIHFKLGPTEKNYFCPRVHDDEIALAPQTSPFANASAVATEYTRTEDLPASLLKRLNEIPADWFEVLRLNIAEYFDHAGCLIVYTARDEIRGDVSVPSKEALQFHVKASSDIKLEDYFVFLCAWRRDKLVFNHAFNLTQTNHLLPGDADIDRWKYQIFHKPSGHLIDEEDATLLLSIQGTIKAIGPSIELRDANNRPFGSLQTTAMTSQFTTGENSDRAATLYHQRLSKQHSEKSKARGELFRFDSEEEALAQIAQMIEKSSGTDGPLYWADPYFFSSPQDGKFVSNWSPSLRKHFLRIVQATQGRSLRILCGHDAALGDDPFDLIGYGQLMSNVEICCIREQTPQGLKNAFHDRWITSKSHEYLLTHSLNGIQNDGLTIAKLPFHVYFAESEYLWSIPTTDPGFHKTHHQGGPPREKR